MKVVRERVATVEAGSVKSGVPTMSAMKALLLTGAAVGAMSPMAAAAHALAQTARASGTDTQDQTTTDTQTTTDDQSDTQTKTPKSAKKAAKVGPTAQAPTTVTSNTEIVVTGQRKALEDAADMKRNSDTISDSIVLDEANKVPSTSLLEVLERTPGLTTNRIRAGAEGSPDGFTFEGSGIQIRGLRGTKTLLNGREIFSASGGSGLSFSDIGPELLRAVTVYKASRADLIAGGVAGTIDLQTYMPFDIKGSKIAGSASGSYGDFSKSFEPSASLLTSSRFHTPIGEIGILADIAYSKIKSYDSNYLVQPYYPTTFHNTTVYAPAGYSATDDQFERTRKGFYAAIQWRPAHNLEFFHTTFISEWNSNRDTQLEVLSQPAIGVTSGSEFDHGVFVSGGLTNRTAPATGIIIGSNSSYTPSYSRVSDYSQGFKWSPGRLTVSGSYEYTVAKSGGAKFALGLNGASATEVDIDTTSTIPGISFPTAIAASKMQTVPSSIAWLHSSNRGHENAYHLDATYDIGEGFFRKLAVGGRIANRTETDNFIGTYWAASAHGWNGVPQPNAAQAPAGDFREETFPDFFKGDVPIPAPVIVADPSILKNSQFNHVINSYAACGPNLLVQCTKAGTSNYLYGNPPDPNLGSQPSFSTTIPKTRAVYAMLGFKNESSSPFLNFSGNIGLRWVRYETQSEGNYVFTGNNTYYATLADAQKSLDAIGGLSNLDAYRKANPNSDLPYTQKSITSSSDRFGNYSKDYFLPSFNIAFKPIKSVVVRYALTRTMTPPSYGDIRAQGTAAVSTSENPLSSGSSNNGLPGIFNGYNYTSGDPTLKPEVALNNDISIEWYPSRGTTAHLALFHKSVQNEILFNRVVANASDFYAPPDRPQSTDANGANPHFLDGPIIAKSNINASGTTIIQGAELGGRTYFDHLPGLFKGLGIDANVTYIDGKSPNSLALDVNGNDLNVPLIGLSKWAYSATLLYDLHKVSARLSYSWRSKYLTTTNDASTSGSYTPVNNTNTVTFGLPVYGSGAGQLSGSIGYDFNKHFNIQFNVENITNADQRTIMEILPNTYVQRGIFQTDRRFSLHVGFHF